MLAKIKSNMKRLPKIFGIALILFLFSLNIQIMLSDNQSGEADLSLFGLKVNLFESTYAQNEGGGGYKKDHATAQVCTYIDEFGFGHIGAEVVCKAGGGLCITVACG